MSKYSKKLYDRMKNDPVRYAKHLEKRRAKYRKRRLDFLKKRDESRKNSPYWQRRKYDRYFTFRTFNRLAKVTNHRCNKEKVSAFQLWCLAKKQKLFCAITGEKLTSNNISVDHKIPISKGGTNNISNLQFVTRHSNVIKNSMTMDELYAFCKNIIDRFTPTPIG